MGAIWMIKGKKKKKIVRIKPEDEFWGKEKSMEEAWQEMFGNWK